MKIINIARFITEEVHRQGYDLGTVEYTEMCTCMGMAWQWARDNIVHKEWVTLNSSVRCLGEYVHPWANSGGFRHVPIYIGGEKLSTHRLDERIKEWAIAVEEERLDANAAYVAFEEIHPFMDGNGRTGKILFNFLNNTLDDPVLPVVPAHWRIP